MSAARLERALVRSASAAGAAIIVERHAMRSWHSATFAGDRHLLDAQGETGARLEAWLARVGALDLALPGHVLADLKLEACTREAGTTRFRVSGLTVATG
jgi:hypothetical protein